MVFGLPPLHGGYRPRPEAKRPDRGAPPVPPRGRGAGSPRGGYASSDRIVTDLAPPPQRAPGMPRPAVPSPFRNVCNEPLYDFMGRVVVGYCDRYVKTNPDGSSRGHKRKPHRIEWRSR